MEEAESEQEEDELPMYQEHYNALFSMDFVRPSTHMMTHERSWIFEDVELVSRTCTWPSSSLTAWSLQGAHLTKLRKFGRARRSSRRPKVTILIWKDRYLSHASRRSGMKPFGSTMRPRLIFYRDMSGKRVNEAHGGFGVSNGPSSSAKGLDRIEKRPG
ncbi:unnamed protein product [Microthlaspi erraticum]|uniref:Uncharacterized protein n=1 Tax=Microthlaspi erraticum TaxID=1685480 RepID=A0A6D2JB97_9BRAS|nr:unnamed protein product [Microthlaspi erraticum]